jgi:hypothetical protein
MLAATRECLVVERKRLLLRTEENRLYVFGEANNTC